jgi:hypothetical protein
MELEVLRERLHEYIDAADEKHLTAIYALVEDIIPETRGDKYDEATLEKIYQIRENHRKGISKSYTVEESMEMIRNHIR